MKLRSMTAADWPAVRRIYQEGIATGHATFTASAPARWEDWAESHIDSCNLAAIDGEGSVVGWAALSPVSERCVYNGVGEVSVYVDSAAQGLGVGSLLLAELVLRSEAAGLWTLQAGIFPENASSISLHAKHGFRTVGVRERVGKMAVGEWTGRWRDVALMERRSSRVGLDS